MIEDSTLAYVYSITDARYMMSQLLEKVDEGPVGIRANNRLAAIVTKYVPEGDDPARATYYTMRKSVINHMLRIAVELREAAIEAGDHKGAEALDYFIEEASERMSVAEPVAKAEEGKLAARITGSANP